MTTARDIVTQALKKISVLGRGFGLTDDDGQDGLDSLNDMLSVWSVEGNLVFTEEIETFPLIDGTGDYTIGSGGDFDTAKPVKITSMYVTQDTTDYSLQAYDRDQYARIFQKGIETIPDIYYYNDNFPLATIRLFPVPVNMDSVTIYSDKVLSSFTTLDTAFAMPPEYKAALIYNLAVWLAPEYERQPLPSVLSLATQTKDAVEAQNSKNKKYVSRVSVPRGDYQRGTNRSSFIGGV